MKAINKIFLLAVAISAFSCDDIIEDDIADDMVLVVSPLEGAEIESNVVNFQWNQLDGADEYRVQVYGSGQNIVVDSVVSSTRFICPLNAGHYQWRVRGENSAYQSSYSFPMGFTLIASDNLENQQMLLSNPGNGVYSNLSSMICTWQQIQAADTYDLELKNVNTGSVVHQEAGITNTSFTLTNVMLDTDGEYQWKVRAVNETSATLYASRNFYIDRVVPTVSLNSAPVNNSVQLPNIQLNFTWTVPADTGIVASPVTYTIEIASDAAFSNIISTHGNIATASYQEIFTTTGDYYWHVKTKDKAGNESAYGAASKFTIN